MTARARQKLKLLLVTDVRLVILLELNHEEVMGTAFTTSMVHDDVRQNVIGLLSCVAVGDSFKSFSQLAITVVFTVHIPLSAEMRLHVRGKTVSGRPFVSLKVQRGVSPFRHSMAVRTAACTCSSVIITHSMQKARFEFFRRRASRRGLENVQ